MKGRMLASLLIMVAVVFVMLSLKPIDKPRAQSNDTVNAAPNVGPSDLIYVGDNVSKDNGGAGIKIFRRDNNGVLTELPKSPVPTGGSGLFDILGFNRAPAGIFAAVDIGPYELDSDLILNADRSRMFVV